MLQRLKEQFVIIPIINKMSEQLKSLCMKLADQFYEQIKNQIDINGVQVYQNQLKLFFQGLKNNSNVAILEDKNHRDLIIHYMKSLGIQHYKISYFNRAKISKKHIEQLRKVGPILFSEAVMIANKINIINKNTSRIYIQDHLYTERQSPVDLRIQQILKLCDQKKRKVNNNLKKLQLILEGDDYLQIIKQLGKMLRDSWKKDKSKAKVTDFVKEPMKKPVDDNIVQVYLNDIDSDQVSKQIQKQSDKSDKLSFTSSQNFLIQNHKQQYAKFQNKKQQSLFSFDKEQYGQLRDQHDFFTVYNSYSSPQEI